MSSVWWSARLTPPAVGVLGRCQPVGRAGRWYHGVRHATMGSCRSCPTSTSSPTRSTRRSSGGRSIALQRAAVARAARHHRRARRARGAGAPLGRPTGQVPGVRARPRPHHDQPDADRPAGPGVARREGADLHRVRASAWRTRGRARGRSAMDAAAPDGFPPATRTWSCATATRRGWARSTCCPRASRGRSPAGTSRAPMSTTPRSTWTRGETRIAKHAGELKNLLKNQAFVAGIGNGYSDEILWAAGLNPFRKRSTLAPEEVDRLYAAARDVPAWAIDGAAPACPAAGSRSRYATSCACTERAASPVRDAARPSRRSRRAGSSPPGAAPARSEARPDGQPPSGMKMMSPASSCGGSPRSFARRS